MLHAAFTPGERGDPPIDCTVMFQFLMVVPKTDASPSNERVMFLNKTRKKAEDGDAHAQVLYAMMMQVFLNCMGPARMPCPGFSKRRSRELLLRNSKLVTAF